MAHRVHPIVQHGDDLNQIGAHNSIVKHVGRGSYPVLRCPSLSFAVLRCDACVTQMETAKMTRQIGTQLRESSLRLGANLADCSGEKTLVAASAFDPPSRSAGRENPGNIRPRGPCKADLRPVASIRGLTWFQCFFREKCFQVVAVHLHIVATGEVGQTGFDMAPQLFEPPRILKPTLLEQA
jgi:hypothetical protein